MSIEKQIRQQLDTFPGNSLLVHTDVLKGFEIKAKTKNDFLAAHLNIIQSLSGQRQLWMPVFNYDFCKGITYEVKNTPSQVGGLNEYFRNTSANWRTATPVFSFAGTGQQPSLQPNDPIDPFDERSAFQVLMGDNAVLMHYGSALIATTLIHYAERMSQKLVYRYDKIFEGKIIMPDGQEVNAQLNMHVRPMGHHVAYDWDRIEAELLKNGILFLYEEGRTRIMLCEVKKFANFIMDRMQNDPLYALDDESKKWINPLLDKLGRPFLITDFEK